MRLTGQVIAVARDAGHNFSKQIVPEIELLAGRGVLGDAHEGERVKHRSRVRENPMLPNLRQVHLIHAELFAELKEQGFAVGPADLGENITTMGIDLLSLPRGTVLKIGGAVRLEVTGLRNPCAQIEALRQGLLTAVLVKGPNGELVRKSGIMCVVLDAGTVSPGDQIYAMLPEPPFHPLERV